MMPHQFFLKYIFVVLFCTNATNSRKCSRKMKFGSATGGKTVYTTSYFCCENSVEYNGNCKVCPKGSTANKDNTQCVQCEEDWYGLLCAEKCGCNTEQRCDNVLGCVSVKDSSETADHKTMSESTTVKKSKQLEGRDLKKDIAIYAGSIGSLMLVICLLSAYIFYLKKFKKSRILSTNTKVDNSFHGTQTQTDARTNDNYRFDHEYEEIDEHLRLDIVPTRRTGSEEEGDICNGYLSPYQPIAEVDVYEYKTSHNNDQITSTDNNGPSMKYTPPQKNLQSKPVDDNRSSGYLNPYQPVITLNADVHEYTQPQKSDQCNPTDYNSSSGYLNPYQPLSLGNIKTGEDYTRLKTLPPSSADEV